MTSRSGSPPRRVPAIRPPSTDLTADVAVIGGGVAGLCTSWELARAGADVVVREADRIAAGVTGYTTAKLTTAYGLVHAQLEAKTRRQRIDEIRDEAEATRRAGLDASS
ncbi:FAD-dependent oxidoreductase [Streptomyces sp. NPDC048473]|uniref:FAD-dependent oxidoreductase n=1 Tax=Streptomyces sp. NPDC048473 TaxID=3365556 RepID=UPI0037107018